MARVKPSLNPPQRAAVEHFAGPLLVLAGPGSGKTRVVTHRIARLLGRGVPARSILAVTFTNKAAREMRERVRALAGKGAAGITISTFHSACCRILRQEIEALGYRKNFSIYDQSSQDSLLRTVLRELGGAGATRSPTQAKERAAQAAEDDALAREREREQAAELEFARVADARYREELRARNAVDFDDLILLTGRLFRERAEVLSRWRERFQFLLVDEYQDTNQAQDEILVQLAGAKRNLCVVGDDDQSIYRWRGAEVEHILRFRERFRDARVVRLEQNYRSTQRIVAAAGGVIARNPTRHAKALFTTRDPGLPVRVVGLRDEEEEARFVAGEIAAELGREGDNRWELSKRFAILLRTNEQTRPFEQALREEKVPYRLLGGRSFFDRKEVLDLLAYLRLAANRDDEEALFRVLNVPARGLGAKAALGLQEEAGATRQRMWNTLVLAAGDPSRVAALSPAQRESVREFVAIIEQVASSTAAREREALYALAHRIGYKSEIERSYKDDTVRAARWALVGEVQRSWEHWLAESREGGVEEFLDSIALSARDDDDDDGAGGVTLATAHASKGLEFPVVYVAGAEEGFFPHLRSVDEVAGVEEERRLFYVAMTRAMDRLTFTRAEKRLTRGRVVETLPSRFLAELPADVLLEHAEERAARTAAPHLAKLRAQLASDPRGGPAVLRRGGPARP